MGHFDNKPIPTELKTVTFDVTESWVNTFNQSALALVITDPSDKEGYEKVKELLKTAVSKRQEVESKRKELNEDALKWQRTVNAEAKRITALLEPSETHLRTQKDFYDSEKERIKKQKELEAEQLYLTRVSLLEGIGFSLIGDTVVNHAINEAISKDSVMELTDIAFDMTVSRFKTTYETYLKEKKEREEQERIKQEEFERQQQELEAMRAEMQRIKQEMEETQRQKEEAERLAELKRMKEEREVKVAQYKANYDKIFPQLAKLNFFQLSAYTDNTEAGFTANLVCQSKLSGNISITSQDFIYLDDSKLAIWLQEINRLVDELNTKDEQAIEKQKKLIEEQLKEKMRLEAEAKAKAEEQERQRQEELKANMSDTERLKSYVNDLLLVKMPELKTKTGIAKLKSIENNLRSYL